MRLRNFVVKRGPVRQSMKDRRYKKERDPRRWIGDEDSNVENDVYVNDQF